VGRETDRADELLRRARELETRTAAGADAAETHAARSRAAGLRSSLEEIGWLAGAIRRVRRAVVEGAQVLDQIMRWTGPLWWIVRRVWWGTTFVAHRASHVRVDANVFEFSPRKTARSVGWMLVTPLIVYAVHTATTRHSGVFLITDKHLVSGDTAEYQMGGCWERVAGQSSCGKGDGEIVLIRPAWIPQTGIFSVTYDEDVGVIPLQGKCELRTYGIYLRTPWMPLLRGALKPVAIAIGQCEGLAAGAGRGVDGEPASLP
jgi:hypothetical protein